MIKQLAYNLRKSAQKQGIRLRSKLTFDRGELRDTLFLGGTGRSGTTWISDIINYKNDYRYMFEPFYPQKVPVVSHFKYRQYIRPENDDPRFLEPARKILSGAIRNEWIDRQNHKYFATKRLVKDIRTNQILKWIKVQFPEIPIILVLRHPCAVANSKLKKNWGSHLEVYLEQDDLMQDFLEPFRDIMENAQTLFEKHIIMWCIDNYIPLKQFRDGGIHLAFYEDFCTHPEREIDRLFRFTGESYDDSIFDVVRRPSALSRRDSAIHLGLSLTESWRKGISEDQALQAAGILRTFGLDYLYNETSLPLISGEEIQAAAGAMA